MRPAGREWKLEPPACGALLERLQQLRDQVDANVDVENPPRRFSDLVCSTFGADQLSSFWPDERNTMDFLVEQPGNSPWMSAFQAHVRTTVDPNDRSRVVLQSNFDVGDVLQRMSRLFSGIPCAAAAVAVCPCQRHLDLGLAPGAHSEELCSALTTLRDYITLVAQPFHTLLRQRLCPLMSELRKKVVEQLGYDRTMQTSGESRDDVAASWSYMLQALRSEASQRSVQRQESLARLMERLARALEEAACTLRCREKATSGANAFRELDDLLNECAEVCESSAPLSRSAPVALVQSLSAVANALSMLVDSLNARCRLELEFVEAMMQVMDAASNRAWLMTYTAFWSRAQRELEVERVERRRIVDEEQLERAETFDAAYAEILFFRKSGGQAQGATPPALPSMSSTTPQRGAWWERDDDDDDDDDFASPSLTAPPLTATMAQKRLQEPQQGVTSHGNLDPLHIVLPASLRELFQHRGLETDSTPISSRVKCVALAHTLCFLANGGRDVPMKDLLCAMLDASSAAAESSVEQLLRDVALVVHFLVQKATAASSSIDPHQQPCRRCCASSSESSAQATGRALTLELRLSASDNCLLLCLYDVIWFQVDPLGTHNGGYLFPTQGTTLLPLRHHSFGYLPIVSLCVVRSQAPIAALKGTSQQIVAPQTIQVHVSYATRMVVGTAASPASISAKPLEGRTIEDVLREWRSGAAAARLGGETTGQTFHTATGRSVVVVVARLALIRRMLHCFAKLQKHHLLFPQGVDVGFACPLDAVHSAVPLTAMTLAWQTAPSADDPHSQYTVGLLPPQAMRIRRLMTDDTASCGQQAQPVPPPSTLAELNLSVVAQLAVAIQRISRLVQPPIAALVDATEAVLQAVVADGGVSLRHSPPLTVGSLLQFLDNLEPVVLADEAEDRGQPASDADLCEPLEGSPAAAQRSCSVQSNFTDIVQQAEHRGGMDVRRSLVERHIASTASYGNAGEEVTVIALQASHKTWGGSTQGHRPLASIRAATSAGAPSLDSVRMQLPELSSKTREDCTQIVVKPAPNDVTMGATFLAHLAPSAAQVPLAGLVDGNDVGFEKLTTSELASVIAVLPNAVSGFRSTSPSTANRGTPRGPVKKTTEAFAPAGPRVSFIPPRSSLRFPLTKKMSETLRPILGGALLLSNATHSAEPAFVSVSTFADPREAAQTLGLSATAAAAECFAPKVSGTATRLAVYAWGTKSASSSTSPVVPFLLLRMT